MRKRRLARRPRQAGRRPEEQPAGAPPEAERPGPYYAAGPALRLERAGRAPEAAATAEPGLAPLPTVRGTGAPRRETAHGGGVRLEGRTDADFGGSSFRTAGVSVTRASGCEGCPESDCVRATGTLVATYRVRTTVTLPSADDFPNLTPCQRQRVQDAITNVLAPHEQQHVAAFRTYDGTTRRPFDLTICRADFDSRIRAMFDAEDQARQDAARAASAVLDPFHFDVDLDCQDEARSAGPPQAPGLAPPAEEE